MTPLLSRQQDAVEENELRKKQEQAMREKQLADEAKQHDPKVRPAQLLTGDAQSAARGLTHSPPLSRVQVQAQKKRQQQHELIAELRRRQAKEHRPVYEGKDGTIEDIITGGTRRRPPRALMTVVIHCSAALKCTLCYVTQTPHGERST